MSIQMAAGEKIIKDFEYTKSKAGGALSVQRQKITKNLIVTNKRIIHRTSVSQLGGKSISNKELPISAAKCVNVSYGLKPYYIFLFLGFIFALLSIASVAMFKELNVATAICLIAAVLFFILFAVLKRCTLTCEILTDRRFAIAMGFSGQTQSLVSRLFSGKSSQNLKVRIKVSREVAQEMTEELGALLTDVINGQYEEVAAPVEAVETAE